MHIGLRNTPREGQQGFYVSCQVVMAVNNLSLLGDQ